jgi:hypothetical protein
VSEKPNTDVALPLAPYDEKRGQPILRIRRNEEGSQAELGTLRKVEGDDVLPANTEFVKLAPREGGGYVVSSLDHAGPANVTSKAYRDNYDAIFGPRPPKGGYLN